MSPPPGPPIMHARSPSEVISPFHGPFQPQRELLRRPPRLMGIFRRLFIPIPVTHQWGMQPLPLPASASFASALTAPPPQVLNHILTYIILLLHLYHRSLCIKTQPGPYPMPPPPANINFPEPVNGVKPDGAPAENYNNNTNHPNHREGLNAHRRGGPRRPSFNNSRKPPCLFFPAGRCKNGYVIFFSVCYSYACLHVCWILAKNVDSPTFFLENGAPIPILCSLLPGPGPPRPRGQANGPNNNFPNLEAKLGNMSVRDVSRQSTSSSSHENLHQMDSYRTNLAKRTELKARADPTRVTRAIAPSSSKVENTPPPSVSMARRRSRHSGASNACPTPTNFLSWQGLQRRRFEPPP